MRMEEEANILRRENDFLIRLSSLLGRQITLAWRTSHHPDPLHLRIEIEIDPRTGNSIFKLDLSFFTRKEGDGIYLSLMELIKAIKKLQHVKKPPPGCPLVY